MVVLNFFPVQKLIFGHFWNGKKWNLAKFFFVKLIYLIAWVFLAWTFFKFSGPLSVSEDWHKIMIIAFGLELNFYSMYLKNNELCFQLKMFLFPCMLIGNPQQDTIPNPFHNDDNADHFKNKKAKTPLFKLAHHNIWLSQVHKSLKMALILKKKEIEFILFE